MLALGASAVPAFGQEVEGDDIQYNGICQNIIVALDDNTQNQFGTDNAAAAQYVDATAEVAREHGVSIAQANECLNGAANTPDGNVDNVDGAENDVDIITETPHGEVLTESIPDQKVLADTGGTPLPGLAALVGLGLVAAGAALFRFVSRR